MVRQVLQAADPKMDKAIEYLEGELRSIRSGRASTALIDDLKVEYYGQSLALKQVATLATPDAHTIAVTPWDKAALQPVEKAIRDSQALGLNPVNDGNTIRLNIPPLSEERRREIAKQVSEKVEDCRIALRNTRHELLSEVRKLEKNKQATKDEVMMAEKELNKKIDQYHSKVADIEKAKITEIMEV